MPPHAHHGRNSTTPDPRRHRLPLSAEYRQLSGRTPSLPGGVIARRCDESRYDARMSALRRRRLKSRVRGATSFGANAAVTRYPPAMRAMLAGSNDDGVVMRAAFFVFPHVGGTFQVFRQLREGMRPLGIDVQWIGVGDGAHRSLAEARWNGERSTGLLVGRPGDSESSLARQLFAALTEGGFGAVFVNVLADAVQTNLVRYLPPHILRIMIVHNITPGTYAAARAVRDHVHATVAISPRVRDDLLRRHGFAAERVTLIPHAVDLPEVSAREGSDTDRDLRVLFLGRIEDTSKGVLSLVDIMKRLPPEITLTVAGEGPDLGKLVERSRELGDRISFLGSVPYRASAELLARHDVMIMPSRFEGFGLTLVEAMAAGCVPVVSRIKGVTDWIVEDGRHGLLFPIDNPAAAAAQIRSLHGDRRRLRAIAAAAREKVRRDFRRDVMASRYAHLLQTVRAAPPPLPAPLELDRWELPRGLRRSLRSSMPPPLKNLLRRLNERFVA